MARARNIKPGFFEGSCEPFTGINVLDVYKVEDAPELDRFQKRAAAMEPGKVKGPLFASSFPAPASARDHSLLDRGALSPVVVPSHERLLARVSSSSPVEASASRRESLSRLARVSRPLAACGSPLRTLPAS